MPGKSGVTGVGDGRSVGVEIERVGNDSQMSTLLSKGRHTARLVSIVLSGQDLTSLALEWAPAAAPAAPQRPIDGPPG